MQADLRLRLALYSPCSPVVGCDLIPMSWRRMAGSGKCRASASEESLHSRVTPHVKRSGCMRPMQGPCLPPLFMSACSNKAGLLSLHAFCTTLTVLSFSTAPFHSFGCRPVAISPIAILHPPQPPHVIPAAFSWHQQSIDWFHCPLCPGTHGEFPVCIHLFA